jgi:hypothetical protein
MKTCKRSRHLAACASTCHVSQLKEADVNTDKQNLSILRQVIVQNTAQLYQDSWPAEVDDVTQPT